MTKNKKAAFNQVLEEGKEQEIIKATNMIMMMKVKKMMAMKMKTTQKMLNIGQI